MRKEDLLYFVSSLLVFNSELITKVIVVFHLCLVFSSSFLWPLFPIHSLPLSLIVLTSTLRNTNVPMNNKLESVIESAFYLPKITTAALNTQHPITLTLINEDLINTPECSQLDDR